jgi:hypothetical protein
MEYTLAATNLLNTKTINDDTFNQTGYRSSQYLFSLDTLSFL